MIETTRLILRPVEWGDLEDIYQYSHDPDVGPHAGWKPHATREETRSIMESVFLGQEGVFSIVWKECGRVIGTIGLIPDVKRSNDAARMLGYAIGSRYWGRGFMTEAATALLAYGFAELRMVLATAYCYPYNQRSARVLEKCGFRYEGTLRQSERRYDGTVLDEHCYSMTKEEFDAR